MFIVRFIGRIVVGLFAIVGGLTVLALLAAFIVWRLLPAIESGVPDNAVLVLNLGDGLVETEPQNPLVRASLGEVTTLRDVVLGLEAAGRDDRVKAFVARLGTGDIGMAQAQEIREAVSAFRSQGKLAIAFAETFGEAGDGNVQYYIATAFDRIYMQPSGDLQLTGFLIETPFLRELLDEIGVTPRLDHRRDYKSAMNTFTDAAMPQPVRENLQRLVDSWLEQLAQGIADGRPGSDPARARALIDRGPFVAEDAFGAALVDRLTYWDAVGDEVESRFGADAELMQLRAYAAGLDPPSDAPRIAIVYGLGPVQLSASEGDSLFASNILQSEAVAGAIRDAVQDPGIEAIIFRIDSPGGSYVASDAIWREVRRARDAGKPLIVSMGNVAASGGYFFAAPARAIVAQPGTITGSIGVVGGKFLLSGLWDELGIAWDGVEAGANAAMNSVNHDYSPAGWAHLQKTLDRIYADFTGKVASGRNLAPETVERSAQGQVWSGADAKIRGLVDELGGLADALRLARIAAGLDPDARVRLEEFPPPRSELEELLRLFGAGSANLGEAGLLRRIARLVETLAPFAPFLASLEDGRSGPQLRLPEMRSNGSVAAGAPE